MKAFAILLALVPLQSMAVALCDVCPGASVSSVRAVKGVDYLKLYCPGQTTPVLTITQCANPRVTRNAERLTVTCAP